jgi:hypothetical protein
MEKEIEASVDHKIDEIEKAMLDLDPVDCPVRHSFYPGLYVREIFMSQNTLITSMKHLTEHPFFVMTGKVSVYSENFGEELIEAPYRGVTLPNTRRVLYIHENCSWITVHRTDIQPEDDSPESVAKAVALIEDKILDKRENPLLGGRIKNNVIYKTIEQ